MLGQSFNVINVQVPMKGQGAHSGIYQHLSFGDVYKYNNWVTPGTSKVSCTQKNDRTPTT